MWWATAKVLCVLAAVYALARLIWPDWFPTVGPVGWGWSVARVAAPLVLLLAVDVADDWWHRRR